MRGARCRINPRKPSSRIGATVTPPTAAPVEPRRSRRPLLPTPPRSAPRSRGRRTGQLSDHRAAYGDFTRKSLEETRSFIEKLSARGRSTGDAAADRICQASLTRPSWTRAKIRGLHRSSPNRPGAAEDLVEQDEAGRGLDFRGAKAMARGQREAPVFRSFFLPRANSPLKHRVLESAARPSPMIRTTCGRGPLALVLDILRQETRETGE